MSHLRTLGIKQLPRFIIESVTHGSEHTPSCGSYGAYTLWTTDGQELVLWTSMGELNLSAVRGVTK